MKTWYQTKESPRSIYHGGILIPTGQKILLTEEQAALHGGAIEKAEPPKTIEECAVKEEFKADGGGLTAEGTANLPSASLTDESTTQRPQVAEIENLDSLSHQPSAF